MTEVSFVCSDEKALFMLKASGMFDGGYRDFVDLERIVERLEDEIKEETTCKNRGYLQDAYEEALRIVKEEVG